MVLVAIKPERPSASASAVISRSLFVGEVGGDLDQQGLSGPSFAEECADDFAKAVDFLQFAEAGVLGELTLMTK